MKSDQKKRRLGKILVVSSMAVMLGAAGSGLAKAAGADDGSNNFHSNSGYVQDNNQDNSQGSYDSRNQNDWESAGQNNDWANRQDGSSDNSWQNNDQQDRRSERNKDNEDSWSHNQDWENKDHNVFLFGRVKSVDDDKLEIERGDKTIKVDISDAKILNRKGDDADSGDIKEGDRMVVRGEFKKDSREMDATRVRDFSLK